MTRNGRTIARRASTVSCLALGGCLVLLGAAEALAQGKTDEPLSLVQRSRVESPGLGGASRVIETPVKWEPKRTAAIVCDMWDLHHCLNAVRRETDMAPRMDQLLKALRDRGVLIIHAPSSCMDAYKDHPARKRAQAVPRSKSLPTDIGQWCKRIPAEEQASYPVDQNNGGEDDDPAEHARWAARLTAAGRNPRAPWKTQTSLLTIDPEKDLITDDGAEVWSALEDRGVGNVILMGVHTNMCVLGRPFGLRQMAKNGKNVVLMRDLTDTMYDPSQAPYVNHFTGTDRVVEHVERWVCPTVTSDQVLGGKPFRYRTDRRPRVAFLVAEDEYKTETTLPPFAARHLGKDFAVSFVFDKADDKNTLTGASAIDDADVLVVSVRRRFFTKEQVDAIRRHVTLGKAVVGIRTASHAFASRGNTPVPEGHALWQEFDPEVLGGHYTNHHKEGPAVTIAGTPGLEGHPVVRGVDVSNLVGRGSLYKVSPLAVSATPLLVGTIPGQEAEPVAWTNLTSSGGRVFYTTLGHVDDFSQPAFQRLLRNAITWAAGLEVTEKVETSSTDPLSFPK
ncbi:MAG: ThuA domain-containing protein [Isosphaeraceae bacterium]